MQQAGLALIQAEACEGYSGDGGFPGDLRSHALTHNAYARGRRLQAQEYMADGEVEAAIERLFARPDIDSVHVRDTAAGCYDLRVERALAEPVR